MKFHYSADCKLGLTIVKPNLLSTRQTLGNWTDGRISCRHSGPTSFLVRTPALQAVPRWSYRVFVEKKTKSLIRRVSGSDRRAQDACFN